MPKSDSPTVTVAIASVGRPIALSQSLARIRAQTDSADEVIVVAQASDKETQSAAKNAAARIVLVHEPGLAHALETAIGAATSEVIAFVDDDAEALPNWVGLIRQTFAEDAGLGLLGGRDNVFADRESGSVGLPVGILRNGRVVGNHHLGRGSARPALHVKGANMSMRVKPASRLPLGDLVDGTGAQARNEFILSLGIVGQGFTARYDPNLQVDHFPDVRASGDERAVYTKARTRVIRHNEAVAIALYRPRTEGAIFVVRSLILGDRICCGLVYFVLALARGDRGAPQRFSGSIAGLLSGLKAARRIYPNRLRDI